MFLCSSEVTFGLTSEDNGNFVKKGCGVLPMTIDREPMEQVVQFIIPAICLVTGIILLCAGARLLKSAIGLSFGLLGAGGGLLLAPALSIGVSPLIIALIFGIIAAIIAVSIAKFAILLILALSFAIVSPVITWHVADLGDGEKVIEDVVEAATAPVEITESTSGTPSAHFTSTEDVLIRTLNMVTQDVKGLLRAGMQRANAAWGAIPTGPRLMLVGTALAGLLVGLLVATFMPYFSSALVTSVGGSFLLIEGIRTIASAIWTPYQMSSLTPTVLIWATIGIALAGLGLQLTLSRKSKVKKVQAE